STLRLLREIGSCASLTVADLNDIVCDPDILTASGSGYQKNLADYDIIFKSPGVKLEDQSAETISKIHAQTSVFLSCFAPQTIGITGTKGKSTTATLLYHILDSNKKLVCLAGNIGIPVFDVVEEIEKDTIIVLELSAQQLEYVRESPHTAVLLNIYEEHLDYFGTFERYAEAKRNIYRYQGRGDILVCPAQEVSDDTCPCDGRLTTAPTVIMHGWGGCHPPDEGVVTADIGINGREIAYNGKSLHIAPGDTKLLGAHNLYNIAIVYALCQRYEITDSDFLAALRTYQPLPHRLAHIGCVDGVDYYDDSISTNCETTIEALTAVENVGTLILGGYERGLDYGPLIACLAEQPPDNIILIPTTGTRIYAEIQAQQAKQPDSFAKTALHLAKDLAEAVAIAKQATAKGKACLLSPAAASYDHYKNFEERGEAFKELVGSG
ncbi:MAG: UDP-N-acetylmuramoyl-L-alanine--D-glutamate ligase, partial [Lachnospiraceae bacterium]|nr:UDP-N-acetylmuramoyl-L-alanine--D-glutamate ligase [Lachnospiraceae bacterium]